MTAIHCCGARWNIKIESCPRCGNIFGQDITTKYGYKGELRSAQIAVRVPPSIAEKLRKLAKERHISQADILIGFIRDA